MKRIREKMRLRSIFSKFFLSFVVLLVVVSLTITALLFQAFSKGSTAQINEISQKRLEQSSSVLEFIANQARLITLQLSLDPDIIQMINGRDVGKDYFLKNAALRKLNDLLLTNKNIYSITLYNGQSKTWTGTDRDKAYAEASTIALLQEGSVQSLGRIMPRKMPVLHAEGKTDNVYTIFYYDKKSDNKEIASAIILNVTLEGFVPALDEKSKDMNLLVLDQQGHAVYALDREGFLEDLSGRGDVQRILSSRTSSSFISTEDDRKTLVSSTYSEQLGWYLVSKIPYDTATAQISDIRQTAIITCLLLLLLALGASAVLSGLLSSPLSKLAKKAQSFQMNNAELASNERLSEMEILTHFYSNVTTQFEKLEATSRLSLISMKTEYIKELLQGIRQPEPADREMYQLQLNLVDSSKLYVAVLKLDSIRELVEHQEEVDHTESTVLHSFTEQYLQTRVACEVVKLEHEVTMLFSGEELEWSTLLEALQDLQREIAHVYRLSVTIGVGRTITQGSEISEAYLTAKEVINYRLTQGEGRVLVYDHILALVNHEFEYPYAKQKLLLEVIKGGKEEEVEAAVSHIFFALSSAPYSMIRMSVHHLLFSIVTASSNATVSTASVAFMDMLAALQRMETLTNMEQWFIAFSKESIQRMKESKKHIKSDLAIEIAAFLEEQYGNSDLSIEFVAERFRYNGIYFGRLFKELFNQLFLEYVTELRIRKANEFLATSKLAVKEIGEKVGFLNASYFVTWYKKHTGLAPTEYRKMQQR